MTLFLEQPEVHDLDCRECSLYIYDPKDWKPVLRGGQKQRRFGMPPPCAQCPKESPAKAAQHELSVKNREAVHFYLSQRAMNWQGLSEDERQDQVLQRNMAIVDSIMRRFESQQDMQQTMIAVQGLLAQAQQASVGKVRR